jgi:hypothetical protein
VSREIIREFLTLLRLPQDIQKLFGREGLKLEHGRRLWQLTRRRPGVQRDVANAMKRLTAHDSRALVELLVRYPELSVKEARERVLGSKGSSTTEYHVITVLNEAAFVKLSKEARRRRVSVDQLASEIVTRWLTEELPAE